MALTNAEKQQRWRERRDARYADHIRSLEARIRGLEATLTAREKSLTAQLTRARTENENLKVEVQFLTGEADQHVRMLLPKGLRKQVLGFLHPDRASDAKLRRKMEKTCQAFSGLPFKEEP